MKRILFLVGSIVLSLIVAGSALAAGPTQPGWKAPRVSIVWPHDGYGRPTSVLQSRAVNVSVWPSDAVHCDTVPPIGLFVARNNEPAQTVNIGSPQLRRHQDYLYPTIEFNDLKANLAADPSAQYRFFTSGSNVWTHAADPRTYQPYAVLPTGIGSSSTIHVDTRIQVVYPHDEAGVFAPVERAPLVNIAAEVFEHDTLKAMPFSAIPADAVHLYIASGNDPLTRSPIRPDFIDYAMKAGQYRRWVFNDVPVTPGKIHNFVVRVEGESYATSPAVWTHAADPRTILPEPQPPAYADPAAYACTPATQPNPSQDWATRTLLIGPGTPGRHYALQVDPDSLDRDAGALRARLMISEDFGENWRAFAGRLPVAADCMSTISLDYANDVLYSSTCSGLYRWSGSQWNQVSSQSLQTVAISLKNPQQMWGLTEAGRHHGNLLFDWNVVRSDDGGTTWLSAGAGVGTLYGRANIAVASNTPNTLYLSGISETYTGSSIFRGTESGQWTRMPAPMAEDAFMDTNITVDGNTGALYAVTLNTSPVPNQVWRTTNPTTVDVSEVAWEGVHTFSDSVGASVLASGWSPHGDGLTLYANVRPFSRTVRGVPILFKSLDGGGLWTPMTIP